MNKLHVTSLPPNTTNEDLRHVFEQIGPVLDARVVNDLNGNCVVGIVEMYCAEDIEQILTSNDCISIGGRRPNIWKVEAPTIGQRLEDTYSGIHLEECKGAVVCVSSERRPSAMVSHAPQIHSNQIL